MGKGGRKGSAKEVVKLTPADVLHIMEELVPFNRYLGLRGESAPRAAASSVFPCAASWSATRAARRSTAA